MKTLGSSYHAEWVSVRTSIRSSFDPLTLVSAEELQAMVNAARKSQWPVDFEEKLDRLAHGDLQHNYLEQNCRLFCALLEAGLNGEFKEATPEELERLARVLAYVRKEDDVISDFRPLGYTDDFQQMRAAGSALGDLVRRFKYWRLRNQVPEIWRHACRQR
jgi:hypothetical protein